MIDEKKSNVASRMIAVPVGEYCFLKECILCGDKLFDRMEIMYENIRVFLNLYSVSSFSVSFPLCASCAEAALEKESSRNTKFNLLAVLGIGLAFLPVSILQIQHQKQMPLWTEIISFFGMFIIVIAFIMMQRKSHTFPIHVRQEKDLRVFTFPDTDSMKRFIAANTPVENDAVEKESA